MHGVIVNVKIGDPEAAESHLREEVVPGVKQAPGLVAPVPALAGYCVGDVGGER